jgi:hypothetical protein
MRFPDQTRTPIHTGLPVLQWACSTNRFPHILATLGMNKIWLVQLLPDVPPAMANAVNQGGELLANLTAGTPWEAMAKEVGNTLGTADTGGVLRAQISKDVNSLVDVIASWMAANSGPRLLSP